MTTPQITTSLIVGTALALFAWGRWRGDLVAALALLAATLAGLVPPGQVFAGFAEPEIGVLAAVLAVGAAVRTSGLLESATRPLGPVLHRTGLRVAVLGGVTAVAAAFVGTVAALEALLPAAQLLARRNRRSPAPVLMPMGFAALLGGLATLIGAPTNLVVSGVRRRTLGAGYALFDFAPVGAVLAAVGLAYLVIAWRLLPHFDGPAESGDAVTVEGYTSEVLVPRGSAVAGDTVAAFEARAEGEVEVLAIIREELRRLAPRRGWVIEPDDVLVLACEPDALQRLMERSGLRIVGGHHGRREVDPERVGVVEAIVAPASELAGRSSGEIELEERFGVSLLAVGRSGGRIAMRLRRAKLRAGDVLVLQGALDAMPATLAALGCLPLAERRLRLGRQRRALVPAALLLAAIVLSASGTLPVAVAFLGAAVLLVLLRALTLNELYAGIAWPLLVLIGAFIPVSRALHDTGTAALAAGWIASAGLAPAVLVALLLVGTLVLAPVVGGVPAALVAAPLGAGLAAKLGVSADPFLMAAAVGASAAFLERGSHANALVAGPGGYRRGDFRRLGLPLAVVVAVAALPLIVLVWPLR